MNEFRKERRVYFRRNDVLLERKKGALIGGGRKVARVQTWRDLFGTQNGLTQKGSDTEGIEVWWTERWGTNSEGVQQSIHRRSCLMETNRGQSEEHDYSEMVE